MQSRQQGEKANIALAPAAAASIAVAAAAASRLITEPNINTGSWITGNSQHAAEQEKKRGVAKKTAVNTEASALHVREERNRK